MLLDLPGKGKEENNQILCLLPPLTPFKTLTRVHMVASVFLFSPLSILCSCPLPGPGSPLQCPSSSASSLLKLNADSLATPFPPRLFLKPIRGGLCRTQVPANQPARTLPPCPLAQLTDTILFTYTSTSKIPKLGIFPA